MFVLHAINVALLLHVEQLGYTKVISPSEFDRGAFEVVVNVLNWLMHLIDDEFVPLKEKSTNEDKVKLICHCVSHLAKTEGIKMNPKALLLGDKNAIIELLKLTNFLTSCLNSTKEEKVILPSNNEGYFTQDKTTLIRVREEAKEIRSLGVNLQNLLVKEVHHVSLRKKSIKYLQSVTGNLGSSKKQDALKNDLNTGLDQHKTDLQKTTRLCTELEQEKKTIGNKVKKRMAELERSDKRMKSLRVICNFT